MLEKLMKLLGTDNEIAAQFSLDDAVNTVMNYCNISEIPIGLETTVIRIAMDIYRHENIGSDELATAVTSVKTGDTATSFQVVADSAEYSKSLCKNYTAQLNRYRKLSW